MRRLPGCLIVLSLAACALGSPVAAQFYGGPRDIYGNLLVVPGYGPAPVHGRSDGDADPLQGPRRGPAAPVPDDDVPEIGIGIEPPAAFQRQVVSYRGGERPGTVIIDTPSRYLYLVQPGGLAIRYGIGVGRPGFSWAGRKTVSLKREWPDWRPPADMLRRRPDLPRHMEGGPDNPLGARALYLGSSLYRIHGTNEPHTIGHAVSSGCIRMLNRDVIDLYARVPVGAPVVVI
ncbi:MAG: L,D-transpeptidase [Microvirga sp.]